VAWMGSVPPRSLGTGESRPSVAGSWHEALSHLRGRSIVALTGAGMSTRSGIPDYRGDGPTVKVRRQVQWDDFVRDPQVRQRYWARASVGWPRFAAARPNPAHRALAQMADQGGLAGLITQNVDTLDEAAGSREVVHLHGVLGRSRCMRCDSTEPRSEHHGRLRALNPGLGEVTGAMAPDGDADLRAADVESFVVADCLRCGGPLRPDVVFFGGAVPTVVRERARAVFDRADVLLVAGTSLTVLSGYRFVRLAAQRGVPVVIVNRGPTRGDAHATAAVDGDVADVLPRLADALA